MAVQSQIFALIAARGGSKGVPRKNLRMLGGKPLIVHTIATALRTPSLEHVIVSTDDIEIAETAKRHGAKVPFLRPSELSTDTASTLPVVLHALRWFEESIGPCKAVILLQPTSPFRPPTLIEDALKQFSDGRYDVLLTLNQSHSHPYWMKTIQNGAVKPFLDSRSIPTRRQDLPPVYTIVGSLYIWSREALLRREGIEASGATQFPKEKIGAVFVEGMYALELDSEQDFQFAELMAQKIQ